MLDKPIAPLRIVIGIGRFGFVAPALDLLRSFRITTGIEPLGHLLVARAALHLGLEIGAVDAFETKKHVVQRAIKMILADIAGN